MNSITINFDDNSDVNTAYNQLKKLFPKNKIVKNDKALDEMLEDEYLLALAVERKKNDNGVRYTEEDIMRKYGITEEDLENAGDVELEYEI